MKRKRLQTSHAESMVATLQEHLDDVGDVCWLVAEYCAKRTAMYIGGVDSRNGGSCSTAWTMEIAREARWKQLNLPDQLLAEGLIGMCASLTDEVLVLSYKAVYVYRRLGLDHTFQRQWTWAEPPPFDRNSICLWFRGQLHVVTSEGQVCVCRVDADDASRITAVRLIAASMFHCDWTPVVVNLDDRDLYWVAGSNFRERGSDTIRRLALPALTFLALNSDQPVQMNPPKLKVCQSYVAAAVCRGSVYATGGRNDYPISLDQEVGRIAAMERWTPGEASWTLMPAPRFHRCCANLICLDDDYLLLVGGHADRHTAGDVVDDYFPDSELFSIVSNSWTSLSSHSALPLARVRGWACVF